MAESKIIGRKSMNSHKNKICRNEIIKINIEQIPPSDIGILDHEKERGKNLT